MYCKKCGAQVPNDACFCTKCGTPITTDEDAPATTSDFDSAASTGNGDSFTPATSSSNDASSVTQAAQEGVTFAEAMNSTKRKGRKKMPLIVLAALVMLLLSATAFAAYYVYTNFVAPQAEQTEEAPIAEQPKQAQEEPVAKQTDKPAPEQEPNTDAKNATAAYEDVIDEFRFVSQSIIERGDTSGIKESIQSNEVLRGEVNTEFGATVSLDSGKDKLCPHVSTFVFMDPDMGYELTRTRYAFKDINDDGIPELFIATNAEEDMPPIIIQAFTYQEDTVRPLIVRAVLHQGAHLCEGGLILETSHAGIGFGESSVYALQEESLASINSWRWEREDAEYGEGTPLDSEAYIISTTQGGKTEEKTIPYSELELLLNQMNSQYPPDTTIEWTDI